MARTSVNVDRAKLIFSISEIEKNGAQTNRSVLHSKVADYYNQIAINLPKITPAIVGLRIKEWKINVITPIGKRGRQAGVAMTPEQKALLANRTRTSRSEKFSKNPEIKSALQDLRKDISSSRESSAYLPLVDKICGGSMKAAVKLMCLNCSNFQRAEIKECGATNCPLYAFRPFQNVSTDLNTDDEVVEPIESEEVAA